MTISNDKRHLEALAMRGRILAHILEPEQAAGVNGPALAANFQVSEQVIASHCNYLCGEKLIQRFIFPRAKTHTPNLWLHPCADLSLIALPVKLPPKPRGHVLRPPSEPKEQYSEDTRVRLTTAKQLDVKRDPWTSAFFGAAKTQTSQPGSEP